MEKIAYGLLIIAAIFLIIAMIMGLIVAYPYGIIGLIALLAFGLLFIKVMKERMKKSKEDRYSKEVEK